MFMTQFPVLHDVKNLSFCTIQPKVLADSAWVPFLINWCVRSWGYPAKLFSDERALGFLPLFLAPIAVASVWLGSYWGVPSSVMGEREIGRKPSPMGDS